MSKFSYYADRLCAERLRKCYELAPPRVRQYLIAELEHVLSKVTPSDRVLELGCGYGRVLHRLADKAGVTVGLDSSLANIELAGSAARPGHPVHYLVADAVDSALSSSSFDVVACIQNGISAFHVDARRLVMECARLAKPGGLVLLSSYAQSFWPDRLEWFQRQADAGLIGEIDREKTGDGVIVTKDGFTASTVSPEAFEKLCADLGLAFEITDVDKSSVFCEIRV